MTEDRVIEAVSVVDAPDPLDALCGIPAESPAKWLPREFRPMTSFEIAWDLAH